jgi:O-antigen ligase
LIDKFTKRVPGLTVLRTIPWLFWVLLLITLPVTSSPLVALLTGRSTVSPLSGIPLFLLLIFWFVPYLIKDGGRLPKHTSLFLLFLGAVLLASLLSPFYGIEPYMGQTSTSRTLRALITLTIGAGFYLTASTFPNTERRLQKSLQWLYLGGLLSLTWATLQVIFIRQASSIPNWAFTLHRYLSIRDMHRIRVTGLAYEPSWLANQLLILFIPLWFSSVLNGYSAFKFKKGPLSIELGLLLWGALVLFFTFSRIGLVNGFILLAFVALVFGGRWIQRLVGLIIRRLQSGWSGLRTIKSNHLKKILWAAFILIVLISIFIITFIASKIDPRIERFFKTDNIRILLESSDPLYKLARSQAYAERLAYWTVGTKVFETYPVLGVGLGNTGFFYLKMLPAYGYRLPETIRIINGSPQFPNPKNLWFRILAETGIVGFLVFILWLIVMAKEARSLFRRGNGIQRALGLAGLMALIAQILEGFSLDTFALPQLWIMLGFVTIGFSIRNTNKPIAEDLSENPD